MKKQLLLFGTALLLASVSHAQNQKLWAYGQHGGGNGWGTIICMNNDGSGLTVAHTFDFATGGTPKGNLLLASDGNIYGTGYDGGSFASCVIYRYDPSTGIYTDVWDFDITNGDYPMSGLVEGGNGKLYGVASSGGTGGGVLYSYDMATTAYTPVYMFNSSSGNFPNGAPILLGAQLYGLTVSGGNYSQGVLYSYSPATNSYVVLHHFGAPGDGTAPYGSVIQAGNGKLYGMTSGGGSQSGGVIFSYDLIGGTYTVEHNFAAAQGGMPYGSLMQGQDGKLYGTTSAGGTNGAGVLFRFDPAAVNYTALYAFTSAVGSGPQGDLSQDNNGNIYGTTAQGGMNNSGAIFKYNMSTNTCSAFMSFGGVYGDSPIGGVMLTASTVGIQQPATMPATNLSVYPNPANDVLNISFQSENQPATFTLRNLLGETFQTWETDGISATYTKTLDISELSSGVYLVEATSGGEKFVQKFVVK